MICFFFFFPVLFLSLFGIYRERAPQFIVQAYIVGPKNVNFQETGPMWLKFEEALSNYEEVKKYALIIPSQL